MKMKKLTLLKSLVCVIVLTLTHSAYSQLADGFDIKKAYIDAKAQGVADKFLDEYVKHQHTLYLRSHAPAVKHNHSNDEHVNDLGTIYKGYNSNPVYRITSPQNAYCPNAGFEQFSFLNWSGSTGDVTTGATGAPFPVYTQTGTAIVSPAGNNVSVRNPNNRHTILTTPATNSVYPNCVGYDSVAVRVIGTQTVSEIPLVNPNGGPASVRVNGWYNSNDVGSKITYNMTLNPNNKSFSVSYALVLNNGNHNSWEQPYFSVKVRDQNGTLVPGCSQYTVTINDQVTTPGSPSYDPLWKESVVTFDTYYRPWSTYAFDFSNYPSITAVTVEFYVGGCSLSGHFGYAYVDASCAPGGAVSSFCAGSNTAILNAPSGFATYLWTGPSGTVAVADGGTTNSATITPVTAGQVFTCVAVTANSCTSTFQTTVAITSVSVTGIGSTPSCPNGNSGSANVNATGSSTGYSYQWLNSTSAVVSNSQTATGLSPGTYSVIVTSPGCGSATETVTVGNAPPFYYTQSAPYCGTTAWITNNGGSNYNWYTAAGTAIAGATTPTLTINGPVNGTNYFLAFTTASGCRDSIKYTLSQIPGGNIYVSNVTSICAGNTNATAVINLQTTASPAVYSYSVTGPAGYNATMTNTSAVTYSLSNMPIGTYSTTVFDGQCLYNTTFTVAPYVYSYTLTPTSPTICAGNSTSLTVNFGNTTPSSCGLSTTGGCATPNSIPLGTGTTVNGTTTYPAPYGNFYESMHFQMLFTATELLAAGVQPGKLSSLSFNVTTLNALAQALPNYTIKLKCTSATSASTFDMTGLLQVYSAPSYNVINGWNTHNFATAYDWTGTTNLLVDICYSNTTGYDDNPSSPYSVTPFTSVVYYRTDGTNTCGLTTISGTSSNRPNVKFGNCGGSNPAAFSYTWTPTTNLNPTTTYTTIANPTVTTIYNVQVEPIGQTNCMQTQSSTVTVTNPVTPSISVIPAMCSNAPSFSLSTYASPAGGTWSLTPATSTVGVFTPSLAAIGNNTVTYTYGAIGCLQSTTAIVAVDRYIPSFILGSIVPQCVTNSTINLGPPTLSVSPLGAGIWSGPGITGTTFDPALAGAGVHTFTYTTNTTPTTACAPSFSTITVSVNSVTQPIITPAGPYCDNSPSKTMSLTVTGPGIGAWSASPGASVTPVGEFIPAASLIGPNKIFYTLTNSPCVKKDSILINVVHYIDAALGPPVGPYCIYNPTVNLQGIATNPGGVWSGTGVSGTIFTPSATPTAGGTYVLTYSTDPAPIGLCPDVETTTITVNPKPNPIPIIANNPAGCNPVTINYMVTSVAGGSADWDFGDGNTGTQLSTTHIYTTPGTFTATLTYTDNVGCVDTTTLAQAVTVYSVPVAAFDANPDVTTVVDAEIQFANNSVGSDNVYQWDFDGDNVFTSSDPNPTNLYTDAGEFFVTLIATNQFLCVDTAIKKVTINPDVVLYVPNAFTPNGDGLNDQFLIALPPTGVDYSTFNLTIYDRWGSVLYRSTDVDKYWNGAENNSGKILKEGVYVWKITFLDDQRKYYERLGHVSLIK